MTVPRLLAPAAGAGPSAPVNGMEAKTYPNEVIVHQRLEVDVGFLLVVDPQGRTILSLYAVLSLTQVRFLDLGA